MSTQIDKEVAKFQATRLEAVYSCSKWKADKNHAELMNQYLAAWNEHVDFNLELLEVGQ